MKSIDVIAKRVALILYVSGCLLHVGYAFLVYNEKVGMEALGAALFWSACAFFVMLIFRKHTWEFPVCISFMILGVYRIGYVVDTMQYAVIVFMVAATVLSVLLSTKLMLFYMLSTNIEIIFVWLKHSDIILSHMTAETYLLIVIFYETQLLVTLLLVANNEHLLGRLEKRTSELEESMQSKDELLAGV